MPILIDGDNLLGTWPGRNRSDGDKRTLAIDVLAWARQEGKRVVLVFDGPDPVVRPPGNVRFAGQGRSADDVVVEILRNDRDPAGWTVVTSDRSLGDRCRWIGAQVVRSDRFRGRLRLRDAPEKPEGPVDVEAWMEIFGASDDEPT